MRTRALARPKAEPGIWEAGGGRKGGPGPGSPEQQAGAERSRVLQPPRSREPGQPPPIVMSAGPLLKGQAARRGSERGLGAAGTAWGGRGGAGGDRGSPIIQLDGVPETEEGQRDSGLPKGACEALGLSPSKHRHRHTIRRACPCPGTTLPISPGGEGPHLGEGSAAVSAGMCSLFALSTLPTPPPPPPTPKWVKGRRPGRHVCLLPPSDDP